MLSVKQVARVDRAYRLPYLISFAAETCTKSPSLMAQLPRATVDQKRSHREWRLAPTLVHGDLAFFDVILTETDQNGILPAFSTSCGYVRSRCPSENPRAY